MSLANSSIQDRRPSPGGMSLNFNSNNPFRDAAASPPLRTHSPALSPTIADSERPMSTTNPFLDNYQPIVPQASAALPRSPPRAALQGGDTKKTARVNTTELMDRLSIRDGPAPNNPLSDIQPSDAGVVPKPHHRLHPRGQPTNPQSLRHRRERSNDDEMRMRKDLRDPKLNTLNIFSTSPEKKEARRPRARRNSDTSVMDFNMEAQKQSRTEQNGKDISGRSQRRPRKNRQVDVIDKLDGTGLYGVGFAVFHHDGPFDACNPHRNRKGRTAAPMQAFAEGSLNNALGGGPVKKLDLDTIHGRNTEGYLDYNATQTRARQAASQSSRRLPQSELRRDNKPQYVQEQQYVQESQPRPGVQEARKPVESMLIYDPKKPDMNTHGQETEGLGASTFLEGAPAPPSALQRRDSEIRRESEKEPASGLAVTGGAGIQRKKSVVDRIRGLSRPQPSEKRSAEPRPAVDSYYGADNFTGGDARYLFENGQAMASYDEIMSPRVASYVQSAGGRSKMNNMTPFFEEEEESAVEAPKVKAVDADQAAFSAVRRTRTTSNPNKGGAARRSAEENGTPEKESRSIGGSLLTRVKSLKGGKKPRPAGHQAGGST